MPTPPSPSVHELRLVVTAVDFDDAVHLYRDVLGLTEVEAVSSPGGRVMILDAGRATLELADPAHAAYIDEVEVGRDGVAGHLRVALRVDDVDATSSRLVDEGLEALAPPTPTPWGTRNSRFEAHAGLQLTLFGPDRS